MNTFDEIFQAYYRLFRGEADVPDSTDDEYVLGLSLANNAVQRWSTYDNVYWKELFDTNQGDGTGGQTITGSATYAGPTNFKEAGGLVSIKDSNGNTVRRYPLVEENQAQFLADEASYAYLTGDPTSGYTLHLNPAPDSAISGYDIDYAYYKTPSQFTTGSSTTEISNPYFIVHNMLAQRFQIERNYGGYQIAKRDSEEALKNMAQANNSGSWANPWAAPDNSNGIWGM